LIRNSDNSRRNSTKNWTQNVRFTGGKYRHKNRFVGIYLKHKQANTELVTHFRREASRGKSQNSRGKFTFVENGPERGDGEWYRHSPLNVFSTFPSRLALHLSSDFSQTNLHNRRRQMGRGSRSPSSPPLGRRRGVVRDTPKIPSGAFFQFP